MGSLLLECPLCCSERFTCHNSLKYHLLSISDNLICPACNKRFEKIFDLAMHLGRQCVDTDEEDFQVTLGDNGTSKEIANHEAFQKPVSIEMVEIKQEIIDNEQNDAAVSHTIACDNVNNGSLLAKALLHDNTNIGKTNESNIGDANGTEIQLETTEEQQSEEDLYYCSSCAIHFVSVEEHIKKYHDGHEVYVEDNEDWTNANVDDESIFMSGNEEEEEEDGDDDPDEYDESNLILKVIKSAENFNTVQEEECVDKNGRLYTRKVVKIERFWDEKQPTANNTENIAGVSKIDMVQDCKMVLEGAQSEPKSNSTENKIVEFYQCSNCTKKFVSVNHYSKHKCSGKPEGSVKFKKCRICKASFLSSEFLREHMKIHKIKTSTAIPEPNPPHICEICNTEFPVYKSLRLHRRMHEPIKSKDIEPPVLYGLCGEQLRTEKVSREMFTCKICNKPYNKEYEQAHAKFHSNKELDFNCDICNRKFFTQENLTMHIRAHTDQKKFFCSYCKKGFLTSEKLEAHMSGKCQKRQYECQYCGRRFARPHEKVKHERIHTGEKPHVCEICGKSFRVSYCLTLHMRTHSGTRPYRCEFCGRRFKAHSVYNHHLLTHSEDRKYKCPFCPKTFKTGVQLAGHKNSHTKPFTCTECNRPFASLYSVRAHMETHQRQNNLKYRCWICGASYARAFALRDHVREQHVNERENNDETEAVILEAEDYAIATENIESSETILDGDENMLMINEIGSESVATIEMADVQIATNVQIATDVQVADT